MEIMNGLKSKTNKLFGGLAAAALILASCGSGEEQSTITTSVTAGETTAAPATTAATAPVEETQPAPPEGAVVIGNIALDVPEDWASVTKGGDFEAALAEKNPAILGVLEAQGTLEQVKLVATQVDWVAVPPEGGVINLVVAPAAQANTAVDDVALGLRQTIEARGFTVTSEDPVTTKLGSGLSVKIATTTPTGIAGAAESIIIDGEDNLMIFTADGLTAADVSAQLQTVIDFTTTS